jgi:hypothetical protein
MLVPDQRHKKYNKCASQKELDSEKQVCIMMKGGGEPHQEGRERRAISEQKNKRHRMYAQVSSMHQVRHT